MTATQNKLWTPQNIFTTPPKTNKKSINNINVDALLKIFYLNTLPKRLELAKNDRRRTMSQMFWILKEGATLQLIWTTNPYLCGLTLLFQVTCTIF